MIKNIGKGDERLDNRYTIRKLSLLSGLSLHTLRYYEKEGILQQIGRSSNGHRIYEERDLAWVQLVAQLRKTGMPIRRLQQLAEWRSQGIGTLSDRRKILEQHREDLCQRIAEMQDSLAQMDRRIELYQALEHDADGMKAYYAQRAEHYEHIYFREDPIRKAELTAIANELCLALADKRILEIACGTGYWTHIAAQTAAHITGIDAAPETLEIAKAKGISPEKAAFFEGDAYELQRIAGAFDAGLAAFWFSHVPKAQIPDFLNGLHRRLGSGSIVFMTDNVLNPGIGGELVIKQGQADSYKLRELPDGSRHEIIKNYFTEKDLNEIFGPLSTELKITVGKCYWWLSYKVI